MGFYDALLPRLFAFRKSRSNTRLDELCDFAPETDGVEDLVYWLVRLVAWVRPRDGQSAESRVRFLRMHLDNQPERRERVARALNALLAQVEVEAFLAYGGISRDFHLLGAIAAWLTARILPAACRTDDVERIVCLALRENDLRWMRSSGLVELFHDLLTPDTIARFESAARDASIELVHQITAQAHAPSLRKLVSARSPFRGLYGAVTDFLAAPGDAAHFKSLRGRIVQCKRARDDLREHLAERGADLNTTYQLMRVDEQLERLALLAIALHEGAAATTRIAIPLARSALRNAHARHFISRSSDLVVRNLVDTTADVGDHYLEEQSSSFRASFFAGCGGGALMVMATLIKFGLGALHLPTVYEGLLFALNYAAAFCIAYLLHYTIATKLPAHTAAALARSLDGDAPRRVRVASFAHVLRALVRLQIGGLVGNIIVAGPLAFAIAWAFEHRTGHGIIGHAKVEHVFAANSVLGPSALYAALTGVFLWVSSLVGAAVDNWARANGVNASLATGMRVMRTVGTARVAPIAKAISSRMGGFVGNAFLGFLLGGVPAFFALGGIPIDIRHVTVSTSSVGIAWATGGGSRSEVAEAVIGVCVIGLVNIGVSFALALRLALRASHHAKDGRILVRLGVRRALRRGS